MKLNSTAGTGSVLFSALAALAVMLSPSAWAQIEEVVVTAQKREQSLQDVSVAVTAVTGDQLVDLGVTDAFRLDVLSPGLQIGLSGSDPRPALRGARTEQVEANDVAVSYYSDGIYRPRHGQLLAGFVDVDRVEVLRGPQGTLFGRNSLGGLIHVINKQPVFDEVDYGAAVTVGDYSRIRGEAFFNVPMGSNAALRVAGVREVRDPYVENITVGDDGGLKDADTTYLRALIAMAPNDVVDATLRLEYWHDDSNGNGGFGYYAEGVPVDEKTGKTNGVTGAMQPRIGRSNEHSRDRCTALGVSGNNNRAVASRGFPACSGRPGAGFDDINTAGPDTVTPITGDPYKIPDDAIPELAMEEFTVGGDISVDLGFTTAKATLSYLDYSEFRFSDCDFSANAVDLCGNDITSETTQQEIQFSSKPGERLQYTVGAFFLQEDMTNAFLWQDIASEQLDTNTPPEGSENNPPKWASWANQIQVETRSVAGYGQASFEVTDAMRVLAGVRYTYDNRTWDIYGQNPNNPDDLEFSVLELDGAEKSWDKVTWKAGVEFDVTPDSMVYAVASTGFQAGNQQGAFNGSATYDEQTVMAYEAGSKNLFMDGRLLVNIALYYNEYEDLTVLRFRDAEGTTLASTENAGAVDAFGVELEADFAATEELYLGARVVYQDAEYGDFVVRNQYQEGGNPENNFQLDGWQVQQSPDFTVTLLGSYTINLADLGTVRPAVTFYYSDDYRTSDQPWFYGNQDSYTRTDLSLTWASPGGDWSVRGFVHNVEDEAVLLRSTRYGGDLAITDYGAPRTFGATLNYRY